MVSKNFHDKHPSTYDRMASNTTTTVAKAIIKDITPPITSESYILDNASGTGIVTGCIKDLHPEARILAADLAPGVLEVVKQKAEKFNWKNVETKALDVRDLKGLEDETFSHVVTNFGFSPDPADLEGPIKAAKEMWRVLKTGGVVVVTTWYERNFTAAFNATSLRIRPTEQPFQWISPGDWERGSWLVRQLEDSGFGSQISIKSMKTAAEAPTLDQLVDNMLLFKDMFFTGYSEEEAAMLPGILAEELRKLDAFEEGEGYAKIGMVAWIGVAWK